MPSRDKAQRFIDNEAERSSKKRGPPKKRQRSNSYDEELEDVSDLGDEDTEEEESAESGQDEGSVQSGDEDNYMDRDMSNSMSSERRSHHDEDERSEEESDIQTPKQKIRRAKLRARIDSVSGDDEDDRDSHRSISLGESSTSRRASSEVTQRKIYTARLRRSTSPDTRPFEKTKFGDASRIFNWRPMAAEERILLTQRGGMIWQVAKPLLARMPEEERGSAAKLLKMLLSSLDAQLSKTPIPSTPIMPKSTAKGAFAGNADSALSRSRPVSSSLMNWVIETGGKIQRSDPEGADDDPDKTMVDDTLKGFEADIAILESMLLPEANEIVHLSSSLREQKKRVAGARVSFDEVKQNARKIDRDAEAASRRVSSQIICWKIIC